MVCSKASASAGRDTIAADVVVGSAVEGVDASRDVDRGGNVAYEEVVVEGSDNACHCDEELPAGQVHGCYSSPPRKPRWLLWRGSR